MLQANCQLGQYFFFLDYEPSYLIQILGSHKQNLQFWIFVYSRPPQIVSFCIPYGQKNGVSEKLAV